MCASPSIQGIAATRMAKRYGHIRIQATRAAIEKLQAPIEPDAAELLANPAVPTSTIQ